MKVEKKKLIIRGVEEEPAVGTGEIPIIFFAILAGLIFVGLLYIDQYAGGFNNLVYRPIRSYDEALSKQPKDPEAMMAAKGQQVYDFACKLCHQPNGLGTPGTFPPLDGSEWVNGPINRLIRIPNNGLVGPITVKGEAWNLSMAAMGAGLTDEELAALLTFIRRSWSNRSSAVTPAQVKAVRAEVGARGEQWTSAELLALPAQ